MAEFVTKDGLFVGLVVKSNEKKAENVNEVEKNVPEKVKRPYTKRTNK